jgi:hypothetical protein
VYGLRLRGVDGAGLLPGARGESWPLVCVERANGDADGDWHLGGGGRRACFRVGEVLVRLERQAARMTVRSARPLAEDQLVHPVLTTGAAMFARWHHRDSFHGGAIVAGGGAWALFATKEGGKSTLLAWLASHGTGVVSDDMLVIEHAHVFAGPRCVDLRPDTAEAIAARGLDTVRDAARRRLVLEPAPQRLPLRGIVHLAWGDEVALRPVPLADRIALLRAHNAFGALPAWESGLLDLAALPTYELRRPRSFDTLARSAELLLATAGA